MNSQELGEKIVKELKSIFDPEIPVDIYELGLIYDVFVNEDSEVKILMRHALGNAAVPIVTVIGIGIALLIGGVVVTESVYNIPGLGRLVLDAVLARDYPIIQGLILFFSLIYFFFHDR